MKTLHELLRHQARFGRLTVVKEVAKQKTHRRALFRCDCGVEKEIIIAGVRDGRVKSCGCLQREAVATLAKRTCLKHGDAYQGRRAPEYGVHQAMINRCHNENVKKYAIYGGRGIRVCDRWRGADGYQNFIADLGYRPSPSHSLDRKDSDGHYEPGNVRWATRVIQSNNKRNNVLVTVHGETMTVSQASARFGIRRPTLSLRLRRGMKPEDAVTSLIKTGPYAKAAR